MSVDDKIAEANRTLIPGRLINGCRTIGDVFRAGGRCANGWSQNCRCSEKSLFCIAKDRWIDLLCELYKVDPVALRAKEDREYFLVEVMTLSQLEATGLTIRVISIGLPLIRFGPKGTSMRETWPTLFDESGPREDAWKKVAEVQGFL